MTISLIGTNGFLAKEIGLFCNNSNISINSFGRTEPLVYKFEKFEQIDLARETIDVRKIMLSDVIIYASGAGVQSNVNESVESIYILNSYIPTNICNELNKIDYEGTFITFGSYFEIGNNSISKKFTENEVVSSMFDVPNDYCVSKRLLTRFVSSKHPSFKHLHLILPSIYGEREAEHRLIPYVVSAIKNKEVMKFTSGKQVRQYIYCGDVIKIIFELFLLKKEGIFNLSGVETFSVRSVVEKINEFYGISINENLFGKEVRSDVGMQNLQLDGAIIQSIFPDFEYSRLSEILKLYDECY